MRSCRTAVLFILLAFILSGCWGKFELTEWGFVQAVAIDETKTGKFQLTTQIYMPGQGGGNSSSQKPPTSYINIQTEGDTVFEALRDITADLGRKAQFTHMRMLLIGEQTAKTRNIEQILDFFFRDQEPRATISPVIVQGKAADYLNVKPLIEPTMGQQLYSNEKKAYRFSAKTLYTDLMDMAIHMHSEVPVMLLPYVYFSDKAKTKTSMAGAALIKKGKMTGIIPPQNIESWLMLTNQYQGGIIKVPCKQKQRMKDSFEVETVQTKLYSTVVGHSLTVHVQTDIEGSAGELVCSAVTTPKEEQDFQNRVETIVEQNLRKTVELLQRNKADALSIGEGIYRTDPRHWKSMKTHWESLFAGGRFEIKVKVRVLRTGKNSGNLFYQKTN